jgi:hypothetical protein
MNPYIEISGRKQSLDYSPLVIAELGINEGSIKKWQKKKWSMLQKKGWGAW